MVKLLLARIVPPRTKDVVAIFLVAAGVAALGAAPQFVSGVKLVEVYATVIDAQGTPVMGLNQSDFIVEEDGARQNIRAFASGALPVSLAFGIDRSFSMSRDRLAGAAAAVQRLIGELRPDDQVMVVGIGSETEVLAPLSRDRAPALAALARLDPWGTTPLYDATLAGVDAIQSAQGRRALVLVSDGSDRYSKATAADVIDRVRKQDVLIYPIGVGKTRPPMFAELAAVTGGRSYQVADIRELPSTLSAIAVELRAQYLLGYAPPTAASEPTGWRSIRVTVTRPGVRVRARDGYMAP